MFKIHLHGRIREFEQKIIGKSLLKFLDDHIKLFCVALDIDGNICNLNQLSNMRAVRKPTQIFCHVRCLE